MRLWLAVLLLGEPAEAQQPFYTDDADVTEHRKFHLEVSNQYSLLQRSAFPNLRQNATVFQLNYGLLDGLELGVDSPFIALFNAAEVTPRTPIGIGDTNITVKWQFRREQPDSRWPGLTVSFAIETPTGDAKTQLGSGVRDYGFNMVVQKSFGQKNTFRLNNGLLFSGNTLTGVVGLKAQGLVYSGGASVTRQLTEGLLLGGEINGSIAERAGLEKSALQTQVGGKYSISETVTIDFGVLAGRMAGSPRVGLQIGFSKDF